jgi:hypothetical protein
MCAFPFCMRIDAQGNASIQVPLAWVDQMKAAMWTCIPEIRAEIVPPRRYQRT